jgi:aspartyl-tRNA(Asn)/glutamyl-tRNA(Gln) amidotransferase subunit C
MKLDDKTVRKIAKLARIEIKDSEVAGYASELSKILDLAEELQNVNTDDVPQMVGVGQNLLRWREDKVTDGNIREDVLKNAPRSEFGCFVVPKVIE